MSIDLSILKQWFSTARSECILIRRACQIETTERVESILKRRPENPDHEIFEILSVGMDKVIKEISHTYEQVWVRLGQDRSPEFFREILLGIVSVAIDSELEWSEGFLDDLPRYKRAQFRDFNAAQGGIRTFAEFHKKHWQERIEDEAKALERRKPSRRGRPPIPKPETKALNMAIARARDDISRRNGNPSSTREIVKVLEKEGLAPIPERWRKEYNVKRWEQLLSKPVLLKLAAKRFTKVPRSSL